MIVDYSEIKKNHRAVVEPIIDSFTHLFPSWVDTVHVCYDENNPGGASASPERPYKRTAINLSIELIAGDFKKLEQYICHEISHCYNEGILRIIHEYIPLLSIEDDTKRLFHKACIDALEFQTEDLARLFCQDED